MRHGAVRTASTIPRLQDATQGARERRSIVTSNAATRDPIRRAGVAIRRSGNTRSRYVSAHTTGWPTVGSLGGRPTRPVPTPILGPGGAAQQGTVPAGRGGATRQGPWPLGVGGRARRGGFPISYPTADPPSGVHGALFGYRARERSTRSGAGTRPPTPVNPKAGGRPRQINYPPPHPCARAADRVRSVNRAGIGAQRSGAASRRSAYAARTH
jgi:hypothetical protein